jgi:hypothetical protein
MQEHAVAADGGHYQHIAWQLGQQQQQAYADSKQPTTPKTHSGLM